jgi:hypothetical protein
MFFNKVKINIISRAIKDKCLISFRFMGHERIVEPYLLGSMFTSRKKILYAWYIDGYTKSGMDTPAKRWRAYPLRKMWRIQKRDDHFEGLRELPFKEESCFKNIIAKVDNSAKVES